MRKNLMPFDAPTGYFDSLSGRTEKYAATRASARQRFLPKAIAASFLLLLAAGTAMLLVQHQLNDRATTMAEQNLASMADELLYYTFDLNESSFSSIPSVIDWEMLLNEDLIHDAKPYEVAEYIFEQDDLIF